MGDKIGAEKDAFGYYFSSPPLDRYAHLARAQGVREIASLAEMSIPEGARVGATIAALIEDARWRTSGRGNRYLMATISDQSGQVITTCFEEFAAKDMEDAARAGGCAVLTVELDKRSGEDTPRVSVKRVQPLESLADTARLQLDLVIEEPGALVHLVEMIGEARGGRSTVRLWAPLTPEGRAELVLGRNFRIDEELVARIAALPGVSSAQFASPEPMLAAAA